MIASPTTASTARPRIEWLRCLPFLFMHLACLAIFWVGCSTTACMIALVSYGVRAFGVTGFYHRYFSHRAFKTSRWFQFVGAVLGAAAVQRGPLWWAAHHRSHHRDADTERDPHSPLHHGFLWSHMAWFMTREHVETKHRLVRDWAKFPELRLLDRHELLVPFLFAGILAGLGAILEHLAPQLGTSPAQLLVWGFFVSTIALHHVTFAVNSVAHRWGSRAFPTRDDSRNSFLLALLTLGEGWHNNHHHYPVAARQGFRWWQIDVTYYVLVVLGWLGLVWGLRPLPSHLRHAAAPPAPYAIGAVSGN